MGGRSLDEIKCIGCGLNIQTENPKEEGYAPRDLINK